MFTSDLAGRPKVPDDASSFHDDDDIMVIGIDFGTTYSGAAWATGRDFGRDQINLITNWPGTGREEGKVPTELFYEDDQIMWGYEVPSDADPVRWFKLLLLKDEDLGDDIRSNEYILRARKMLKENGKTAIDLIADYLRALWKHVLETISKSCGESVVDALAFHVVITVPAIWKGYVRQGMEEAAKQAGILENRATATTTLSFVPEPEAAALSTLCEPGRKVKKGDVYMIVDAGGGTVDLICYKIKGLNPMVMCEAVEGTGGLCGGVFIDEGFERICKARLGRKWDHLSKAGIKEIMKGEWEYAIKPQFKPGNGEKEYIVRIPAEAFGKSSLDDTSRQPFIKKGRIHFRSSDIQRTFEETFSGIDSLVDEQLRKAVKQSLRVDGIILVGGLGASPYLYEHLKARHARAGIVIFQSGGIRSRTAICRGAITKGFIDGFSVVGTSESKSLVKSLDSAINVISTVARVSLGVSYNAPFDETKHVNEKKVWESDDEQWMAKEQMKWFLKRGENVSKKEPLRYSFYKKNSKPLLRFRLYQCEDEVPPSRLNSSVRHLCDISCKVDTLLPVSKSANNFSGERFRRLAFDLEMVPSGAAVESVIYIDGRRQEVQNAQIDFR